MKTKLKSILDEKGIKQNWLADKIGVSPATINALVSGKRKIPKSKAIALGTILNVEPEELLQDEK